MINRGNWKLIKAYLHFRAEVVGISKESLRMDETRLRHVLLWAEETPFVEVNSIHPSFGEYLLTARTDGRDDHLSPAYNKKVVSAARQFGEWLVTHRQGYKRKLSGWLDTLQVPRRPLSNDKQHEAVTMGEINEIAAAPAHLVWQQRIQAAAIFWFLSGIRIGAFVTLPLLAVDLSSRAIKQWPELGVKTKNGKHSTTYLLNIPVLLEIVEEWDDKVRDAVPGRGYWFAPLSSKTGEIDRDAKKTGENRDQRARTDLRRWLTSVGLPYHSPHKFRHGFAVHALKQARDMADFKAVSMNLMHSNMSITDGIYSILSQQDISERIGSLDKPKQSAQYSDENILCQIEALLEQRQTPK